MADLDTKVTDKALLDRLNAPAPGAATAPVPAQGGDFIDDVMEVGGEILATADDLVRSIANGITGNFADEAAAYMDTTTGRGKHATYEGNLAEERKHDASISPYVAIPGEIMGAVMGPGKAVAPFLRGGGGVAKTAKLIGAGATEGAIAGFGSGEGNAMARLGKAQGGAILGGGASALAIPAAKGANALLNAVRRETPLARAAGKVSENMRRDGIDAPTMKRGIREMGDQAVLADVGGGNVLGLGRSVQRKPGPAKDHIESLLSTRLKNNRSRIQGAVKDGLSGEDAFERTEALIKAREKAARPLYDKARLHGALTNPDIIWLTRNSQPVKQAIKLARKFAPHLKDQPDTDMQLLDRAYKHIGGMAHKATVSGNRVVARELNELRVALKDAIVQEVPIYGKALDTFSDASTMIDAIELGRGVFKKSPYELRNAVKGMTKSEREMTVIGVAQQIRDELSKVANSRDAVNAIFKSEERMAQLEAVFPDKLSFNQFKTAVEREITFSGTKRATLTGSDTARNLAEMADEAKPPTGAGAIVRTAADSGWTAAVADFAGKILEFLPIGASRIGSEKARAEIGRLLFTQGVKANETIIDVLGTAKSRKELTGMLEKLLAFGGASQLAKHNRPAGSGP